MLAVYRFIALQSDPSECLVAKNCSKTKHAFLIASRAAAIRCLPRSIRKTWHRSQEGAAKEVGASPEIRPCHPPCCCLFTVNNGARRRSGAKSDEEAAVAKRAKGETTRRELCAARRPCSGKTEEKGRVTHVSVHTMCRWVKLHVCKLLLVLRHGHFELWGRPASFFDASLRHARGSGSGGEAAALSRGRGAGEGRRSGAHRDGLSGLPPSHITCTSENRGADSAQN